jgi:acetamidase/formamidase
MFGAFGAIVSSLVLMQATAAPRTVRYDATINTVKYTFGPAEPVARVRSGEIVDTNTLDAAGGALQKRGDTISMAKGFNPLSGPFFIEGAMPGDTIAIKFLDLQVQGKQGWGANAPGFGILNTNKYTPMISPDFPENIWFYDIDQTSNTATFKAVHSNFTAKIPMKPFLGCVGVAPAGGESRNSQTPGEWGGNMDSPEASVGHTLYLPVNVAGALLYVGDGHAAQGDGELAGTAIEVATRVRFQVDVIKGRPIDWPRFETADTLMAFGSTRPLDDALRIATSELVKWIEKDYGLNRVDAYELISIAARIHLTEMVDPNFVVIVMMDKKYLPPKR